MTLKDFYGKQQNEIEIGLIVFQTPHAETITPA